MTLGEKSFAAQGNQTANVAVNTCLYGLMQLPELFCPA